MIFFFLSFYQRLNFFIYSKGEPDELTLKCAFFLFISVDITSVEPQEEVNVGSSFLRADGTVLMKRLATYGGRRMGIL